MFAVAMSTVLAVSVLFQDITTNGLTLMLLWKIFPMSYGHRLYSKSLGMHRNLTPNGTVCSSTIFEIPLVKLYIQSNSAGSNGKSLSTRHSQAVARSVKGAKSSTHW